MRAAEFFGRFLFVRKCACCGKLLPYEYDKEAFCDDCREKWEKAKTEDCPLCRQAISECTCMPKCMAEQGVVALRRMTHYHAEHTTDAARNGILFCKDNRSVRVSGFFASQIAFAVREELAVLALPSDACLVSFVPRSRGAIIRHGFDQAEMLAKALGAELKIPYAPLLTRAKKSREQKTLSAAQRRKNAMGQFAISQKAEGMLDGACVILVDDIVTTGAGMAACAQKLRQAGARTVLSCVIATVPEKRKEKVTK